MPKLEERWNSAFEDYLENIKAICELHSSMNNDAGYHFKYLKVKYGLPVVLIPVIMSPVSLLVDGAQVSECNCETNIVTTTTDITTSKYLNSIGFLVTGVFSGIYNFFGYGEKVGTHFDAALAFDDICTEIDLEIVKDRDYRVQADVFLLKVTMKLGEVLRREPTTPGHILKSHNTSKKEILEKKTKLSAELSSMGIQKRKNIVTKDHSEKKTAGEVVEDDFSHSNVKKRRNTGIEYHKQKSEDTTVEIDSEGI